MTALSAAVAALLIATTSEPSSAAPASDDPSSAPAATTVTTDPSDPLDTTDSTGPTEPTGTTEPTTPTNPTLTTQPPSPTSPTAPDEEVPGTRGSAGAIVLARPDAVFEDEWGRVKGQIMADPQGEKVMLDRQVDGRWKKQSSALSEPDGSFTFRLRRSQPGAISLRARYTPT